MRRFVVICDRKRYDQTKKTFFLRKSFETFCEVFSDQKILGNENEFVGIITQNIKIQVKISHVPGRPPLIGNWLFFPDNISYSRVYLILDVENEELRNRFLKLNLEIAKGLSETRDKIEVLDKATY